MRTRTRKDGSQLNLCFWENGYEPEKTEPVPGGQALQDRSKEDSLDDGMAHKVERQKAGPYELEGPNWIQLTTTRLLFQQQPMEGILGLADAAHGQQVVQLESSDVVSRFQARTHVGQGHHLPQFAALLEHCVTGFAKHGRP
ncbi:unnamed protein product [Polarella glacialis]|uniref:Uncharacterized protein n=1 Tax=Polarella glacialis TaxID=89957 RepID=A0A813GXS9_POLGL|nr:unnamed protein product [Polarella glacialis]